MINEYADDATRYRSVLEFRCEKSREIRCTCRVFEIKSILVTNKKIRPLRASNEKSSALEFSFGFTAACRHPQRHMDARFGGACIEAKRS
jgi:hypothetical protein